MRFREYIDQRLDEGENQTILEGLQNDVRCSLIDFLANVPKEDLDAEVSNRQKESDRETLIWLAGRSDPSYVLQQ